MFSASEHAVPSLWTKLISSNTPKSSTLRRLRWGKLSEYRTLQGNQVAKILDDRPEQDSVPPASLLYDGFGHFLDPFRRREEVYDLSTKRRDLETLASDRLAPAVRRLTYSGRYRPSRTSLVIGYRQNQNSPICSRETYTR